MQRILVTGGAGFIGSHLCDALDDRGLQVRVLDDLSTGSRANLRPDVDLRVGDVASPAFVKHALDGVDACFHLAAVVSVPRSATHSRTASDQSGPVLGRASTLSSTLSNYAA